MRLINYTPETEEDLLSIWRYIAPDNEVAADRILDTIYEKCALLADNPLLGQARPDIAPQLRHFVVGRYLILYRETEDGILIVRVIHGSRDMGEVCGEN